MDVFYTASISVSGTTKKVTFGPSYEFLCREVANNFEVKEPFHFVYHSSSEGQKLVISDTSTLTKVLKNPNLEFDLVEGSVGEVSASFQELNLSAENDSVTFIQTDVSKVSLNNTTTPNIGEAGSSFDLMSEFRNSTQNLGDDTLTKTFENSVSDMKTPAENDNTEEKKTEESQEATSTSYVTSTLKDVDVLVDSEQQTENSLKESENQNNEEKDIISDQEIQENNDENEEAMDSVADFDDGFADDLASSNSDDELGRVLGLGLEDEPKFADVSSITTIPFGSEERNHQIPCVLCTEIIRGSRYKCPKCHYFNICSSCEKTTDHVHDLLKIRKPHTDTKNDDFDAKVSEIEGDFPDGCEVLPGSHITKMFMVRNSGLKSWPSGVKLTLLKPKEIDVEFNYEDVIPLERGQEEVIELGFTAANIPGEYFYLWSLCLEDDAPFGSNFIASVKVISQEEEERKQNLPQEEETKVDSIKALKEFDSKVDPIEDNYPLGGSIQAGTEINKLFMVKNTGSKQWPHDLKLIMVQFKDFKYDYVPIASLAPDEESVIEIQFNVGIVAGDQCPIWSLATGDGKPFGGQFNTFFHVTVPAPEIETEKSQERYTHPHSTLNTAPVYQNRVFEPKKLNSSLKPIDDEFPRGCDIPVGTFVKKSFILRNNGTEKWPQGTKLTRIDFNILENKVKGFKPLDVNEETMIEIEFTVPAECGYHWYIWSLHDPTNTVFGSNLVIYFKIVKKETTSTLISTSPGSLEKKAAEKSLKKSEQGILRDFPIYGQKIFQILSMGFSAEPRVINELLVAHLGLLDKVVEVLSQDSDKLKAELETFQSTLAAPTNTNQSNSTKKKNKNKKKEQASEFERKIVYDW
eukprot:CAMPEP_0115012664 /NCGR_PEP_ID=MMETSP0216-20121206/24888_1 /TAXON_ID=223996 /ORGANISM="Protocruzia adherens, Strain Boccale" /LENGTH=860 /DNA_ID=CAMNT_0002381797 /DNA_START=136 /DNA_END=2715 /DNA_ORIENTATION=-